MCSGLAVLKVVLRLSCDDDFEPANFLDFIAFRCLAVEHFSPHSLPPPLAELVNTHVTSRDDTVSGDIESPRMLCQGRLGEVMMTLSLTCLVSACAKKHQSIHPLRKHLSWSICSPFDGCNVSDAVEGLYR